MVTILLVVSQELERTQQLGLAASLEDRQSAIVEKGNGKKVGIQGSFLQQMTASNIKASSQAPWSREPCQ